MLGLALSFGIIFFIRLRISRSQNAIIEKQSNERKVLLQEIHHRVKNNFQIICSILKLQAYEEGNEKIEIAFNDAINRIHLMASVHEIIYKQELFSEISPEEYLGKLIDALKSYTTNQKIEFTLHSDVEKLDIQVLLTLGIAINELITNSIKYAFSEKNETPKISIELTRK